MNQNEEIQKGLEAFLDSTLMKETELDLAMTPHKKVQVTKQSAHGLQEPIYGQSAQPQVQPVQAQLQEPIYGQSVQPQVQPVQAQPSAHRRQSRQMQQPVYTKQYEEDAPRRKRPSSRRYVEEEEIYYVPKKQKPPKQKVKKQKVKKIKKQKQGKEKKKHSFFKIFLFLLCLLAIIYFGGMYAIVSYAYDKMHYEEVDSFTNEPMKEDGVINVLLIGNDSRENGEDGRSDAMILLSISQKTKTITMTSLLRDMYVEIPGHDGNRLNAAYAYGGPELLMETIEYNFDIPVSRYVLVNFQAFANLVDAVGGIDLEVTNDEVQLINGYLIEYNQLEGRELTYDWLDQDASGMLHLNGPQALAYTRNRYIGTDFGRTERQRKVLAEVFHKLPSAMLTNGNGVVDGLFPNLTTNMTKLECYQIGLSGYRIISYDLNQQCVPIEGSYHDARIRNMAVLEIDFEANKEFLMETIYDE